MSHDNYYGYVPITLTPTQSSVLEEMRGRLAHDEEPVILLAGRHGGKTIIAAELSNNFRSVPQVYIGDNPEDFERYAYGIDNFVHYKDEDGLDREVMPNSLLFVDGILLWQQGERLLKSLLRITARIVILGYKPTLKGHWIDNFKAFTLGPYASWELNTFISEEQLRAGLGLMTKEKRMRFNIECATCAEANWKPYTEGL